MGPTVFGCRGLWVPLEQGCHGSYVLACPSEVRDASVVLDDPPVYVAGDGACTATVSAAFDLTLELRTLLLQLESRILDLLVLCPQLLHPQARQGPCISLDLVVGVIHRSSPSLVDTFDVSLGGASHETFSQG